MNALFAGRQQKKAVTKDSHPFIVMYTCSSASQDGGSQGNSLAESGAEPGLSATTKDFDQLNFRILGGQRPCVLKWPAQGLHGKKSPLALGIRAQDGASPSAANSLQRAYYIEKHLLNE